MASPTTIGDAEEGQIARLTGKVCALPGAETLVSPIGRRPCVYYAVQERPGEPRQSDARDFYLEDSSGRALVIMDRYRVNALADRVVQETLSVLDADIQGVSERLRALKTIQRTGSPAEQRETLPALRRLKQLATLLCSIRAHARGRVHGGNLTLEQQADLIRELSARFDGAEDVQWARSLELHASRREVVLEQGAEVTVEGVCRREPDPDPAAARHYRDLPLRLVVRAPGDGVLRISGKLADRTVTASPSRPSPPRPAQVRAGRRSLWWLAAAGIGLAGLLYWLFGS